MALKAPQTRKLDDADAEQVRISHDRAIRELQTLPASQMRVIGSVELPDGVAVKVPHGLGRAPYWAAPSCVRGAVTAGWIEDGRTASDRDRFVTLTANDYGATITIDLAVL